MAASRNVIVRKTRKEDLGAVLAMIQELADFEKMSDGPQLTVEDLIRDGGFDEDQTKSTSVFHSYVLELTDQIRAEDSLSSSTSGSDLLNRTKLIGYAICFYTYSTWQGKAFFLEDIYVRPDYRKHGYGKLLFTTLVQRARENGCSRFDFHVLAWNPAKNFYQRMGAENLTETEEWQFFRLTQDKMDKLCKKSST